MSLTLKDLRVIQPDKDYNRLASLADLVEVLKQEGAFEVTARPDAHDAHFVPTFKAGRFLVLPLGDTP